MKSTPYTFLVSFSLLPPFSYPHYLGPVSWRNLYLPGLFSDGGKKSTIAISTYQLVQLLSRVQLFATPWTAAGQASLSITNSQSLLKLMSIELVMLSNHLILCHPLFVRDILNITDFILEYVLSYIENLVLTISKLLLICFILISI